MNTSSNQNLLNTKKYFKKMQNYKNKEEKRNY